MMAVSQKHVLRFHNILTRTDARAISMDESGMSGRLAWYLAIARSGSEITAVSAKYRLVVNMA